MSLKAERLCNLCHAPEPTKKCARCRAAYYCSAECALIDWNVPQSNHRQMCISLVEGIMDDDRPMTIVSSDGISSITLNNPASKRLIPNLETDDNLDQSQMVVHLPLDLGISGKTFASLGSILNSESANSVMDIEVRARDLWNYDPRVYAELLRFADYTGYDQLFVGLSVPLQKFVGKEGLCDKDARPSLMQQFSANTPNEVIDIFRHALMVSFLVN